jgi:RNA polymerase sigma-70 factor, ECF subfamily
MARAGDDTLACEAFTSFAEDLWRGMPGFANRSSVRVWAFAIARNALAQLLRGRQRERRRARTWSSSMASRVAEQVRTETLHYLRTDTKQRFHELRRRLDAEEQTLLVLRINERMSWDDIARIHLESPADADVKREAAKLRKRFQLVREKLREMARAEGLLDDDKD